MFGAMRRYDDRCRGREGPPRFCYFGFRNPYNRGAQMAIWFIRKAAIWSACAGLFAACQVADEGANEMADDEPAEASTQSAITLGSHLGGIADADFNEARDNFNLVEAIDDGVGPVFNEVACGRCHTLGAAGGAGEQIERRFGRVAN